MLKNDLLGLFIHLLGSWFQDLAAKCGVIIALTASGDQLALLGRVILNGKRLLKLTDFEYW